MNNPNLPLVFGQAQTVGISISATSDTRGGEFTLGYKDANFAIVPTAYMTSEGRYEKLYGQSGEKFTDALSTLGQFQLNSQQQAAAAGVGLDKFFATGIAAMKLGEGFRCKLGCPPDPPKED
jgi:hypothetical protein